MICVVHVPCESQNAVRDWWSEVRGREQLSESPGAGSDRLSLGPVLLLFTFPGTLYRVSSPVNYYKHRAIIMMGGGLRPAGTEGNENMGVITSSQHPKVAGACE